MRRIHKRTKRKNIYFMIVGTFIIGSIVWGAFIYNDIFGNRISEQVSADAISIDDLNSLTPIEEIELFEKIKNGNEHSELILNEWAKRRDAIGYYSNLTLARKYRLKGINAEAFYEQALSLYSTKEINFEYAEYLKEELHNEKAIEIYKELLPEDETVKALLSMNISYENIIDVLIQKKRWQETIYLYEELKEQQYDNITLSMERSYAIALGNIGNFESAFPALKELHTVNAADEDIKWWYGRALEEAGQKNNAKEIFSSLGERGAYRLGLILENEGKLKEAAETFSKGNSNMSLWRGAQIWDEMGIHNKALETYLRIAKDEGTYQDDAAYRAYILLRNSNRLEVEEMLKILERHPAWMIRIGKKPLWRETPNFTYTKPEFLKRVEAYRELYREDFAKVELSIGERNANNLEKLALGDWYYEEGNFPTSIIWGVRALREEPSIRAYELAYPRAFEEEVINWSKEYNVDPYLVWAITREESHFRHTAISRAGAIGLMQIMPTTSKDIAGRLKTQVTNKDLLIPDINIRFGTFYIRSMLNMFSGDMDKALAAYNGGSGNVRRWSRSSIGSKTEGFATSITFLETREYITKVTNSYYIYKWLYEEQGN